KNLKQFKRWSEQADIHCYRLYDADMPEYAAAIDIYQGVVQGTNSLRRLVHVQEYAAPKTIEESKAAERFADIEAALPVALDISPEYISFKQRRRNRGTSQYEKLAEQPVGDLLTVTEGEAKLHVNIWQYL